MLPTGSDAEPILKGSNTINGLLGERGGTLDHTDHYVRVIGPPSADWISGFADAPQLQSLLAHQRTLGRTAP